MTYRKRVNTIREATRLLTVSTKYVESPYG
jgi:hypothetical protein